MTQFASDAFGGTEDTELSTYDAAWVKVTGVTGDAEISSGRARPTSTTTPAYYNTATPASADYSVEADLYFAGGTGTPSGGPIGRCSTSANTFYHTRLSDGTNIQLYKFVAGAATQLGSNVGITQSTGTSKNLKLNMSGTTIEAYYDLSGTPSITQTDSAITADGHPGLRWSATSAPSDSQGYHADNFSADEAGGGGTTISGALGTAAASGHTGAVNANRTIAGALGTATATGFQGAVNANTTIAGSLGTAVASGLSGTVSNTNDTVIGGTLGIAIASGLMGTVNASTVISGNLGTAVASGLTGTVSNGTTTDLALILKILSNRQELNATTGKFTLYDDDGVTVLYESDAWEDTAGTIPYRGKALRRIDALA